MWRAVTPRTWASHRNPTQIGYPSNMLTDHIRYEKADDELGEELSPGELPVAMVSIRLIMMSMF